MQSVNTAILIGYLGISPKFTSPESCYFPLATHRAKKVGDQWVKETDWHLIRVSGGLAERCRGLTSGQILGIEGSLHLETWVDQEGKRHSTTWIAVHRVSVLSKPQEKPATPGQLDDEVPF